jgi:hypothetical protein
MKALLTFILLLTTCCAIAGGFEMKIGIRGQHQTKLVASGGDMTRLFKKVFPNCAPDQFRITRSPKGAFYLNAVNHTPDQPHLLRITLEVKTTGGLTIGSHVVGEGCKGSDNCGFAIEGAGCVQGCDHTITDIRNFSLD